MVVEADGRVHETVSVDDLVDSSLRDHQRSTSSVGGADVNWFVKTWREFRWTVAYGILVVAVAVSFHLDHQRDEDVRARDERTRLERLDSFCEQEERFNNILRALVFFNPGTEVPPGSSPELVELIEKSNARLKALQDLANEQLVASEVCADRVAGS
jgi:hypothetical protein